jgi:hypothetical protein
MENETETTPTEHRSKLVDVLQSLEREIEKQNSFKYSLLRGMIYGLGTVIGATVLVTLLAWLVQAVTDISITF